MTCQVNYEEREERSFIKMKLCIYVQDYETALNLHWAIGAILFHLILPYPVPCLTVNCCHYRKQIISETHLLCVSTMTHNKGCSATFCTSNRSLACAIYWDARRTLRSVPNPTHGKHFMISLKKSWQASFDARQTFSKKIIEIMRPSEPPPPHTPLLRHRRHHHIPRAGEGALRRGRKPVAINTAATTYHRGRKTLERGGEGGRGRRRPHLRRGRRAPPPTGKKGRRPSHLGCAASPSGTRRTSTASPRGSTTTTTTSPTLGRERLV
jgi:hypothetical protein